MRRGASCRRPSATRCTRTTSGTACAPARCRWWRPTIAPSPPSRRSFGRWRLHQDPERHRRARGPHAGALDPWRRHRAPDDERVRRRDLDQHRAASSTSIRAKARSCRARTPTSWSGIRRPTRRSRAKTQVSVIDYNVFEGIKVTGLPRYHALARRSRVSATARCRPSSGAAASSRASPFPRRQRAALQALTRQAVDGKPAWQASPRA